MNKSLKVAMGFRLSVEAIAQLKQLAAHHGLSMVGVLEMLIRDAARKTAKEK